MSSGKKNKAVKEILMIFPEGIANRPEINRKPKFLLMKSDSFEAFFKQKLSWDDVFRSSSLYDLHFKIPLNSSKTKPLVIRLPEAGTSSPAIIAPADDAKCSGKAGSHCLRLVGLRPMLDKSWDQYFHSCMHTSGMKQIPMVNLKSPYKIILDTCSLIRIMGTAGIAMIIPFAKNGNLISWEKIRKLFSEEKMNAGPEKKATEEMEILRRELFETDQQIARLIMQRKDITIQLGILKKQAGIEIFQPGAWLDNMKKIAANTGYRRDKSGIIAGIFTKLHLAAITEQAMQRGIGVIEIPEE